MPAPTLRLLADTIITLVPKRNEFVRLIISLNDDRWYLVSKQLFVQPVLFGRQLRDDRMLHGENPVSAAQRVVSKLFPDLSVKHIIPTQKAINFGGSAPKRYHWPVAAVCSASLEDLSEDLRSQITVISEETVVSRPETILLKSIQKEFAPRLENLKRVAATMAA
jgi:hypothetical protein